MGKSGDTDVFDFSGGSEEDEEETTTLGKRSNGTNGTTKKKNKEEQRDETNADENGEKNVSTAYAQKIIDRETKWPATKCVTCLATLWFLLSAC